MNGNTEPAKCRDVRVRLAIAPHHNRRPVALAIDRAQELPELSLQPTGHQTADEVKETRFRLRGRSRQRNSSSAVGRPRDTLKPLHVLPSRLAGLSVKLSAETDWSAPLGGTYDNAPC